MQSERRFSGTGLVYEAGDFVLMPQIVEQRFAGVLAARSSHSLAERMVKGAGFIVVRNLEFR